MTLEELGALVQQGHGFTNAQAGCVLKALEEAYLALAIVEERLEDMGDTLALVYHIPRLCAGLPARPVPNPERAAKVDEIRERVHKAMTS